MFKRSFLKELAGKEGIGVRFLEEQLKRGRVVVPRNKKRKISKPVAIGEGCRIKVNTNIGTSTQKMSVDDELKKIKVAAESGTDTIMDLSVGGNLGRIRKQILKESCVAVGTVPVYEVAFDAERRGASFEKINFNDIMDVLKRQAESGVDFFTIHAGILKSFISAIKRRKRVGGIVSRGGAILARWMYVNKKENPFYENFDKILELAKEYNVTLSLGDALRPGAIADSTDDLQISELKVLGTLVKRCREAGVQVIVEGPGHIRLDEIAVNMILQKKLCDRAPFYVLGPLPTDIAAGYDHISASIGGAIASFYGADFLCVVTPAEHLRLPSLEDIRDGVIASKIAAHSVDVLRFKDEWKKDYQLSLYRARRNWEKLFPLTIDEKKARKYRKVKSNFTDMCTMCGKFCSLKIIEKCDLLK
ncbi:MAG: phosphomethylpyrimidine synthase ThiC [Candidatus Omnitrophota bacterium]|nr:MAG: phosphomethylpyrimidine synthase ThiC [Candidatus Omnitrophota bacterium]